MKQVPVEEDAYNTKVITLARTGALPEVIAKSAMTTPKSWIKSNCWTVTRSATRLKPSVKIPL
ncbi:hypothetical protein ACVXG7_21320 [Enterobacter hormaechei]